MGAKTKLNVRELIRDLKTQSRGLERAKASVDRAITLAEQSLAAPVRTSAPRRRRKRSTSDLDPNVQAGHNKGDMLRVFRRARGPLTQAEAAYRGHVVSGASTWAIRALLQDGLIEPTGGRRNRSEEYRLTRKGRKVTRLGPGQ